MHVHGVLLSLLYIKPVYDSIKCRVIGYVYLLPFLLSGPEMRRYRKN